MTSIEPLAPSIVAAARMRGCFRPLRASRQAARFPVPAFPRLYVRMSPAVHAGLILIARLPAETAEAGTALTAAQGGTPLVEAAGLPAARDTAVAQHVHGGPRLAGGEYWFLPRTRPFERPKRRKLKNHTGVARLIVGLCHA